MIDNPYPVMHGSMWKEPQTVAECLKTDCKECAYRGEYMSCNDGVYHCICFHLSVMRSVERLKQ